MEAKLESQVNDLFTINTGGSLLKLVYLAKDEWEASSTSKNEVGLPGRV